jgi:hypothetical protein
MNKVASKRLCEECGKPLSSYNDGKRCFSHPAPLTKRIRNNVAPAYVAMSNVQIKSEIEAALPPSPTNRNEAILYCVCKYFKISPETFFTDKRYSQHIAARHTAVHLVMIDCLMNDVQASDLLKRDRSTMSTARRNIEANLALCSEALRAIRTMEEYKKYIGEHK